MFRKLIGACVGLAMMGVAGSAVALPISPSGPNTMAFASFDLGISLDLAPSLTEPDSLLFRITGNFTGPFTSFRFQVFDLSGTPASPESGGGFGFSGVATAGVGIPLSSAALPDGTGYFKITAQIGSADLTNVSVVPFRFLFDPLPTSGFTVLGEPSSTAPNQAPEPSTLALFATGLALLAFIGWRRRRSVQVT